MKLAFYHKSTKYLVSDTGIVFGQFRGGAHRSSRPEFRLLSPHISNGYPAITFYPENGDAPYRMLVHIMVLETFVGPRPPGMEACHHDGNRANNNVENLRWDTHLANVQDTVRMGRVPKGDNNLTAKLRSADIPAIRAAYSQGISFTDIAKRHAVNRSTIARVISGRNWKHVPEISP